MLSHHRTANTIIMGETVNRQRAAKQELDHKLSLSHPTRKLLEELAIACANDPNNKAATFQYGFALSKSTEPSELRYAVQVLDSLVIGGFEHQIDCMYGAAIALYLLRDYEESRSRCEAILRTNPDSRVAKELHLACIESSEEDQRQQLKQIAVGSVAVAVGVGILGIAGALLSKR